MKRNWEKFAVCPPLTASRRVSFSLWNTLLLLVGSCLFSFLGEWIIGSTPAFQQAEAALKAKEDEVQDLIVTAHLGEKTETGGLKTQNELADAYLHRLNKASLLRASDPQIASRASSTIYDSYASITPELDNAYSYFVTFKPANIADFVTAGIQGKEAYVRELTSSISAYFDMDADYPYLNEASAFALDEAFRNPEYEAGLKVQEAVTSRYVHMLSLGAQDFQDNYKGYLDAFRQYDETYQSAGFLFSMAFLIGAGLGWLVFELILPLCLKGNQVVGLAQKNYRLGKDGKSPRLYQPLIRAAIKLLSLPMIGALSMLLLAPVSGMEVLFSVRLGALSPLFFCLMSAALALVDWLGSLLAKTGYQTLSDLASSMMVVDGSVIALEETKDDGADA